MKYLICILKKALFIMRTLEKKKKRKGKNKKEEAEYLDKGGQFEKSNSNIRRRSRMDRSNRRTSSKIIRRIFGRERDT